VAIGVNVSGARHGLALVLCAGLSLTGCDPFEPASSPIPPTRPLELIPSDQSSWSEDSLLLARLYRNQQADLLTQGLLRRDGGGPDTPFTVDDLVRDFEALVFYDEFARGFTRASRRPENSGRLGRWSVPVRITTEFGASVPQMVRDKDRARVSRYAARLGRVTGHSINTTSKGGNFHVLITGEDDRDFLLVRLKQLLPGISQAELNHIARLPASTHCLVTLESNTDGSNTYKSAVALIRTEHPDLTRLSCLHEEIAQGLGLPNDSPKARPSIFNDDDEFALLTNHDELLLKMLYDPRLKPGMTLQQAQPVMWVIARELMGVGL